MVLHPRFEFQKKHQRERGARSTRLRVINGRDRDRGDVYGSGEEEVDFAATVGAFGAVPQTIEGRSGSLGWDEVE